MSRAAKCKHPRLRPDKCCKDCGQPVDLTAKRSKYGNRRTDGFDSAKEARRHRELVLMQAAGEISGLHEQSSFTLEVNGKKICEYVSDFDFIDSKGRYVVEDVKGMKTAVYRIKKRLMKACHNIDILET